MDVKVKANQLVKALLVAAVVLVGSTPMLKAQDDAASITDESLRNYIMVMDSIDVMKKNVSKVVNSMLKDDILMQGGRRFVEIRKVYGDSTALVEAGVNADELKSYETIIAVKDSLSAQINTVFPVLIKEQLGVKEYKAIKRLLARDADLKARYVEMKATIKEEMLAKENEGGESGTAEEASPGNAPGGKK